MNTDAPGSLRSVFICVHLWPLFLVLDVCRDLTGEHTWGFSLKAIVSKLNDTTRNGVRKARPACAWRAPHYDTCEIEHFVMKLLDSTDSDFAGSSNNSAWTRAACRANSAAALDKLKTGNARTPSFSHPCSPC